MESLLLAKPVRFAFDQWIRETTASSTPLEASYRLTVKTGDVGSAGTDADLTFILEGEKGSITKMVDAYPTGLFERNGTNTVDLQGKDLGKLVRLTVKNDGTGNGSDWFLDWIRVESAQLSAPASFSFAQWIPTGSVSRTPLEATYRLTVKTGDVGSAGTDADLTFILEGEKGSLSKTIDAYPTGLFERGDTNAVELKGKDLGKLLKLTVKNDGSGNGPDWYLQSILVEQVGTSFKKTLAFNRWVESAASAGL